jgi:hypothetical protein
MAQELTQFITLSASTLSTKVCLSSSSPTTLEMVKSGSV